MSRGSGDDALAHAAASLVGDQDDVADSLATLVADCASMLGADAVALLVRDGVGTGLRLLSATSHRAVELEMLQAQHRAGPCVDCLDADQPVMASGREAIESRWGEVGRAVVAAGYTAVLAVPMHYRGVALGGVNIFHASGAQHDRDSLAVAQAVADMASLLVVHAAPVDSEQMWARMHEALSARELVEQAKGVIAWTHGVDMEEAYAMLLRWSADRGSLLTGTALAVVEEAKRR